MKSRISTIRPTIVAAALATTGLAAPMAANAEVSGNIGVTSNYVWRGVTQSAGQSAVSGGLDWSGESGLYAGTWTSNSSFGSPELDFYGGYAGSAGSIEYDLGVVQYMYPQEDDLDWLEIAASIGTGPFSLSIGITSEVFGTDSDATYIGLDATFPVKEGLDATFHVGSYDFDDEVAAAIASYVDYSISLSKDDFTITLSDTDLDANVIDDGDPTVTVSWSKSFDL